MTALKKGLDHENRLPHRRVQLRLLQLRQVPRLGPRNGVHYIECGLIDGVSWAHGLGYPHLALYEDRECFRVPQDGGPRVRFSQVDARFPCRARKVPLRRALRDQVDPVGLPDRLPRRRYHRRPARRRGLTDEEAHGADEMVLRSDHRDRRGPPRSSSISSRAATSPPSRNSWAGCSISASSLSPAA